MTSLFHNPTLLDYDHAICERSARESMTDNEEDTIARILTDVAQNACFGLYVQRRRGFIEDQYPRALEQGPRDREPLLLAARQPGTALADLGLIALRQSLDRVC